MGCRYFFVALPVLIGLLSSCNSDNLGDNIYLLEGDRREDRVIVQCTGKSFGDCIAGTYLIPMAYEEHFDKNGDYSKFVDSVKSDNDYVIATTISVSNGIKTYWIIDKKKKRLSGIKEQHPFICRRTAGFNLLLRREKKKEYQIEFLIHTNIHFSRLTLDVSRDHADFFASSKNFARPISVSGCFNKPRIDSSGQVQTSAPASAHCTI